MQYDVIIVGGGASGCSAASFLFKEGLKIALLDKQPPCPDKICTTAINPRSFSYLEKLDVLKSLNIDQYVKIQGLQTFAYDGSSFQGYYNHKTSYPEHGYCIPRYQLDLALRENILNKTNIDCFESILIEKIEECSTSKQMIVHGRHQNKIQKFTAKIVIDAMGRHSVIGKQKKLFHIDSTHKRYAILAQFSGLNSIDPLFTIGTNKDIGPGYCTIFPIQPDGLAMIALIIPEKNWLEFQNNKEMPLSYFLKQDHEPLRHWLNDAKQESKTLSFGPIAFHSTAFTMPQLFMIGDSTGFYDPLTGEGLTQAFITADWAAKAVVNFFRGQNFTSVSQWYGNKLKQYKEDCVQHSQQLQNLLQFPNAFNRFVYSLSQNQEAANWLACAVGNVFPPGERISGHLKELLFSSKKAT